MHCPMRGCVCGHWVRGRPDDVVEVFREVQGVELNWEEDKDTATLNQQQFEKLIYDELREELAGEASNKIPGGG